MAIRLWPTLVTVLGVLEFQADRDFYYRAIHGINLKDCLAGVMWAIQAVGENAVPLRNAGVIGNTISPLYSMFFTL